MRAQGRRLRQLGRAVHGNEATLRDRRGQRLLHLVSLAFVIFLIIQYLLGGFASNLFHHPILDVSQVGNSLLLGTHRVNDLELLRDVRCGDHIEGRELVKDGAELAK